MCPLTPLDFFSYLFFDSAEHRFTLSTEDEDFLRLAACNNHGELPYLYDR